MECVRQSIQWHQWGLNPGGDNPFGLQPLTFRFRMAESHVSAFPLPPTQYINFFTDENVKRGKLPPPPQPIQETYAMFGNSFTADDMIVRPLESQGFRRLHPQIYDHKRELKKLNHSILANFLDLLDILIKSPDSPKRNEKLEDLNLLFIHMHHLINEFRPHQARETLRVMMELQKQKRDDIAERFQVHLDKVMELIQRSLNALPDDFSLDSKVLVKSEILTSELVEPEVSMEAESCDQLDRMMCDIVDGIN